MSRPAPQRKWGIRTLLFLALAAASIIVSNWMRMTGNTDVILLTFIGLLVGLIGATISTIQGFRVWGAGFPARSPRATAASAPSSPACVELGRAPRRRCPPPGLAAGGDPGPGGGQLSPVRRVPAWSSRDAASSMPAHGSGPASRSAMVARVWPPGTKSSSSDQSSGTETGAPGRARTA